MITRRRSFIGGLSLLVGMSSGAAVLVTRRAVAAEGRLVCTVGPSRSGPADHCMVSDPDGLRTIRIENTGTNQQQDRLAFSCAGPPASFSFDVPARTRYKVFVTDCSVARVTTTYVIRPDGTVVQPTTTSSTSTTTTSSTSTTTSSTTTSSTTTTMPPGLITPSVFLGYADTENGSGGGTPDPWNGPPGVTFVGCRTEAECGPGYDGGAIRIDNPAANPDLTLTDAYVDIETCHFRPWIALLPATVGPGGVLILTQTGVLGPPQPSPCDATMAPEFRALENFDTSEGPFDTLDPRFFNCDPNRVRPPVITLVFSNGMVLTVTDADKILNTGGIDRFACTGAAETTPWTAVAPANIVRT